MKKNKFLVTRRHFFQLGTVAIASPMLLAWTAKSEGPSARCIISANGKQVGVKVSEGSQGQLIVSAREMKGEKLFLISLGVPGGESSQKSHRTQIRFKDGSTETVRMDKNGRFSTSLKGVKLGPMNYVPGKDNENSAQDFFSWLADKISDVVSAVAAVGLFLTGKFDGSILTSTDTFLFDEGCFFKLEPGLEEEGNVWY